jgi:flagellar hook-associated protein 3 FlgL
MRITNSMVSNSYLYNLNGNLNRLTKYLEQESTGKAINSISDDPIKTAQSLSARNKLAGISRYKENVGTADNWLSETEESVSVLNKIIGDAYELTVGASTGTMNDDDLRAIAEEIAALRDDVLSTANTTFGSSFLFAGYNTQGKSDGTRPYLVDTKGDLYYNGINMSNEASFETVAKAAGSAAKALSALTASDTLAQGVGASNYNEIILHVADVLDAANSLAAAAASAAAAADDIGSSADIDAATYAGLAAAAGTLGTSSDMLSSAIETTVNALAVAQSASAAADKAHTALQEAQAAGDGAAIAAAQTAYDDAVQAAEDAASALQTASAGVLTASTGTMNAMDDGDALTTTDVMSVLDGSASLSAARTALDAQSQDALSLQVGPGQTMKVSVTGPELLGRGDENLYFILDSLHAALTGGAKEGVINGYVTRLQDAQSRILSLQAQVGAKLTRIDTLSARYDENYLNYTKMKSDAEDADLAEVITNYSTAQTVYNAALSAGAEIIQTSLLDFLR